MKRLQPARAKRRLTKMLQELREGAEKTQIELGQELGWSQSKVQRIENGLTTITKADLYYLLNHFGIRPDGDRFKELDWLGEQARAKPRYGEFRSILTDRNYAAYLEQEEGASSLRQHEPSLVPGILQTERYSMALLHEFLEIDQASERTQEELLERAERIAALRQRRQEDLIGRGAEGMLRAEFLINEAVIRQAIGAEVGDKTVMTQQLKHLQTLARVENVSIGILTFGVGSHRGMQGPFVVLDFAEEDESPLLYVENARGDYATNINEDEIRARINVFQSLQQRAVYGDQFDEVIESAIREM
ncbi:helix-turn-helix domain-containing protein [Dactylosporangium matsuzakiense]|nr:helix-turn-helix transcriptional regulator [Dactylosporangium matsuzakiense]UWZ43907.1 helix-turn-helix transcriptional regulator [Dactylosporangium matsuzakiense]